MRKLILTAVMVLAGIVGIANAQEVTQNQFVVGYNYLHTNLDTRNVPPVNWNSKDDSHGFTVGYTRFTEGDANKVGVLGLTGEFTTNFNSNEATMITALVGGTLEARNAKTIQPYARVLGGVARQHVTINNFRNTSDTTFAFDVGAGVDWRLKKRYSLRTGVDYLNNGFLGERQDNIRATVGLVF